MSGLSAETLVVADSPYLAGSRFIWVFLIGLQEHLGIPAKTCSPGGTGAPWPGAVEGRSSSRELTGCVPWCSDG